MCVCVCVCVCVYSLYLCTCMFDISIYEEVRIKLISLYVGMYKSSLILCIC